MTRLRLIIVVRHRLRAGRRCRRIGPGRSGPCRQNTGRPSRCMMPMPLRCHGGTDRCREDNQNAQNQTRSHGNFSDGPMVRIQVSLGPHPRNPRQPHGRSHPRHHARAVGEIVRICKALLGAAACRISESVRSFRDLRLPVSLQVGTSPPASSFLSNPLPSQFLSLCFFLMFGAFFTGHENLLLREGEAGGLHKLVAARAIVRLRFRFAPATPDTTLRPSFSARLRHA
ncbi:hypothetical protein ACVW16_002407 [Bradyrhizobium sp. USDA 4474]